MSGKEKMEKEMRLDKFLAGENLGSRKEVGIMIRRGRVAVNGAPAVRADQKINPEEDAITLDASPVGYAKHSYLMLHKPAGLLSATRDKKAETVLSLVPESLMRRELFPAGRLDKDTTGLLILTDDGDFAHRMLAPKSHVYKLYEAELDAPVTPEDEAAFLAGIVTAAGQAFLPARLLFSENSDRTHVRVRIREGKFHQVKRMFAAREKQVVRLKRLQIGELVLDPLLEEGACRPLTEAEVAAVFRSNLHEKII